MPRKRSRLATSSLLFSLSFLMPECRKPIVAGKGYAASSRRRSLWLRDLKAPWCRDAAQAPLLLEPDLRLVHLAVFEAQPRPLSRTPFGNVWGSRPQVHHPCSARRPGTPCPPPCRACLSHLLWPLSHGTCTCRAHRAHTEQVSQALEDGSSIAKSFGRAFMRISSPRRWL